MRGALEHRTRIVARLAARQLAWNWAQESYSARYAHCCDSCAAGAIVCGSQSARSLEQQTYTRAIPRTPLSVSLSIQPDKSPSLAWWPNCVMCVCAVFKCASKAISRPQAIWRAKLERRKLEKLTCEKGGACQIVCLNFCLVASEFCERACCVTFSPIAQTTLHVRRLAARSWRSQKLHLIRAHLMARLGRAFRRAPIFHCPNLGGARLSGGHLVLR